MADGVKVSGVKEKPVKKSSGLSDLEIKVIEERLTQQGGTLPIELGTALSIKFGGVQKELDKATTALAYLDKGTQEERKKNSLAAMKKLEEVKAARLAEIGDYAKKAMDYITTAYGEITKDPSGRLIGYGTDLEILPNRHIHKIW